VQDCVPLYPILRSGPSPRLSGSRLRDNWSGFRRPAETAIIVVAGLDPAIHGPAADRTGIARSVDHQVEPGDDNFALNRQQFRKPIRRTVNREVGHVDAIAIEWMPF
jgi:hypothetical protein